MKELSFDLKDHSLPTKKIVFYHQNKVTGADYEDIFREIGPDVPSGNVLFVIDQFQNQSSQVFKQYLVKYRHYTPHHLHRMRYKNYYVFPRHRHTIARHHHVLPRRHVHSARLHRAIRHPHHH